LLTFSPEDKQSYFVNSILLRLEHFFELKEDPVLSTPVTLDLKSVFGQAFNLLGVDELALGANMKVEQLNERLKWNSMSKTFRVLPKKEENFLNDFTFEFHPMQIRTFRIWYGSQ
jgi:hypothetical protein